MSSVWYMFSCTLYIRLFIETSLYVLLTSFNELDEFSTNTTSLSIAIIAFFLSIIFFILTVCLWIKYRNGFDMQQNNKYFKELYAGLKEKHKARLYPSLIMIRKIVFAIFLITWNDIEAIKSVGTFLAMQTIYLMIILLIMPYKSVKDNIMETINEVLFTTLIIML